MSNSTFVVPPALDDHILRCARAVRDTVGGVSVTETLGVRRQRTFRHVVQARHILAEMLRRTTWYRRNSFGRPDEWMIGSRPDETWRCISYPMLAYMFGRDHTCFVVGNRYKEKYAELIIASLLRLEADR